MPTKLIPDTVKDEIRERSPLLNIVEANVNLKRVGTSFKGLCPFHDERTPSFHVNTAKNTWYCFGCGEGGDVFTFVQKLNAFTFPEAVRYLAERCGVIVDIEDDPEEEARRNLKSRILKANEAASLFYQEQLRSNPDADPARTELTKRNMSVEQAIEHFKCGYAPRNGRALHQHLTKQGFNDQELSKAGLIRNNGYDFFQGRLLWTINNQMGRTLGFGARHLYDDDRLTAKYINTPETEVYKKSHVLYGLDLARKTITDTKHAVVVEGYTDVMACHLAGITNAVASCGTAFGVDHLTMLRRIMGDGGEVTSGFDDDNAGRKAAIRFHREARAIMRRLTVLPPSGGMDPEEYRRARGDEALRGLVAARTPLVGFVIDATLKGLPTDTVEDRSVALDELAPILLDIPDTLVRDEYARNLAEALNFPAGDVLARIGKGGSSTPGVPSTQEQDSDQSGLRDLSTAVGIEQEVLRLIVQDVDLAESQLDNIAAHLHHTMSQNVAAAVSIALETDEAGELWPMHVAACAEDDTTRRAVTMLAVESSPIDTSGHVVDYLNDLLRRADAIHRQDTIVRLRKELANPDHTPEQRRETLSRLAAYTREK